MTPCTLGFTAAVLMSSLGAVATSQAQGLADRKPAQKSSLEELRKRPDSGKVVVKFHEGRKVRLNAGRLNGLPDGDIAAIARLLTDMGVPASNIKRLHARPEAELDAERGAAERDSGQKLADLNLYFVINLPAGVPAAEVADRLNRLPSVEYAEPGAIPAPPPVDIAPATPNLKPDQGYLVKSKGGIGALQRSRYKGAWGKGLKVADVEYSWQIDHEDLEIPATRILTGGQTLSDPFNNNDHGTAVVGEFGGKNNGYGVTGIAPDAAVYLAPANTTQSGYSPARAIGVATGQLARGDVIIIEQQYWACGASTSSSIYGPVEVLQDVFDAVSVATAKGIVVIEAAGNGNINLDGASCRSLFDRSFRDSGAIIVGAGSASQAKLSFSSYGSRVDVQGWGQGVTTTGYGDEFFPGNDDRQKYTAVFSGTSSATPIVTGAALQVNGIVKACGFPPLTSKQMRKVLADTGTPQSNPSAGKIGPLPDVAKAVRATKAKACFDAQ
jgi:hypothetical protein